MAGEERADLQVWAVDRRENVLEDTAMFAEGLAGTKSLQEVFDYYLGWISGATPPSHYEFLDSKQYAFAKEWGMEVALNDLRAVVQKARKKGKDVVLGGHSVGASLAISYAAWDFNGKPGYKDLEGTVLIDGGLLGSFDPYNLQQAQEAVNLLNQEDQSPFLDLLGIGVPEAAGLFAEVGGLYAQLDPTGDGSTLQNFPLLPDSFKPSVPATNRGSSATPSIATRRLPTSACFTSTAGVSTPASHRPIGRTATSLRSRGSPRSSARSRRTGSTGSSRDGSRSTRTAPTR